MTTEQDHYPYWRRIWQIVSGNLKNASKQEVEKTLYKQKDDIVKNVLLFKKSETSTSAKINTTEDISSFISRTADYLNVDTNVAWKILKSYIINEYCGSLKSIKKLKYEMQILPMLNNVWKYYTSERMFIIKTLKTVIEFMKDTEHPYSSIYKNFVEQIDHNNIWKSLCELYEYLISEIAGDVPVKNQNLIRMWVERNNRELVDVLHCLIMFTRHVNIKLSHFQQVLMCCKMHGFGSEPLFFGAISITNPDSLAKLKFAEVALLLCIAQKLWARKDQSWYYYDENLNSEIVPLAYRQEHGAVCYIWMTLHLTLKNKQELFQSHFYKLTHRAISLGAMKFFHDMIVHEMFQEAKALVGACVQDALYSLLALSCANFDGEGEFVCFPGVVSVVCELLKNRHICERYFKELKDMDGYVSLWSTALEMYPYDVVNVSLMAEAIILSGSSVVPQIINQLNQLPWCTELYVPNIAEHTPRRHSIDSGYVDTVKLLAPRIPENLPFPVEIPAETEAVIRKFNGNVHIHYKYTLNYWQVFSAELNILLSLPNRIDSTFEKLNVGFRLMHAILKTEHDILRRYPFFMDIVLGIFAILDKFSTVDNPPVRLLATCLNICTELLHKYRSYICAQLETFKLLPTLAKTKFTYEEMFHINFLEPGKIGNLILCSERCSEQHLILISYLNFLRTSFMVNDGSLYLVELPGLVFVLKEVFPHFMLWYGRVEHIYQDTLYQLVHFVFEMFQFPSEKLRCEEYSRMRSIAYQCFLNESCGRCLLRILSVGNSGIQNVMEGQTNWQTGNGVKYISVIQKAMAILIQLIIQRKNVVDCNGLTPLEHLIYSENDSARYVQAIASFMNHPFNEAIPNLACRLLKKFAVELQMSMLAALDLEPDQVRLMFIQRLRDHLECEELKLAIIEFISASIPKQPGMTEAFFKVAETATNNVTNSSSVPVNSQQCFNEGIGSFLVEYLHTFSSDNSHLNNPLLARVMALLHVLWMNQKEILIADIIKDEQFWPTLCRPLFTHICFNNKTYSEIINIMAKEIHKKSGSVDEPLKVVLQKLFSCEEPHLDKWLNHIFRIEESKKNEADSITDTYAAGSLVLSWKDFLIISIKFLPASFFPNDIQTKLVEECRKALQKQVLSLIDNSVMTFLAELYLFLISNWSEVSFKEDSTFYVDVVNIMQKVALCYQDLPARFRESVLAISVLTLRGLKMSSVPNAAVTQTFVEAIGMIFNAEYDAFIYKFDNNLFQDSATAINKENKSFLMCFETLNELLVIQNAQSAKDYNSWFGQSQLLRKLITCVKKFLERKSTLGMAKVAVESLIHYARSSNTNDFLYSDISIILWEKLLPSAEYRHYKFLTMELLPWDLQEWWLIYKRVIMLLNVLLEKHSYIFLREILMFVSLHEEYIIETVLLARQTVDLIALNLIIILVMFIHNLLRYQKNWRDDHEQSLYGILEAIKVCMNCALTITMRPNILKYYTINNSGNRGNMGPDFVPNEILIEIINRLTDIVTLTSFCIMKFSPPLYILLRDNTDYSKWSLQLGTSFGMPTLGDQEGSELTFGSLICISSLYVRILQQMSNSKKSLSVTSPREILVARKTRFATTLTKPSDVNSKAKSLSETKLDDKTDEQTKIPDEEGSADKDLQLCFSQIRRMAIKQQTEPVGFVKVDYVYPICGISAVENFTSYASPVKSFPWFSKLGEDKTYRALETVITLLGSQVSLILHHNKLIEREERLVKRELCSELQSFHEFVRKRLVDLYRYSVTDRSNLTRKKFGIVEFNEPPESGDKTSRKPGGRADDVNESMLNFRGLATKRALGISGVSSLTKSPKSLKNQNEDRNTSPRTSETKAIGTLFEVKLIPEDYLHFLSLWFSYVLQYINNE